MPSRLAARWSIPSSPRCHRTPGSISPGTPGSHSSRRSARADCRQGAPRLAFQPKNVGRGLARDDDLDEVGSVAVEACRQALAYIVILTVNDELALGALFGAVEIADVPAERGGGDADRQLLRHIPERRQIVEAHHQIGPVDEQAAAARELAVDMGMFKHLAMEVDRFLIVGLLRREEFEEIVVDWLAMVVTDERDDLQILMESLPLRWVVGKDPSDLQRVV